MLEGTTRLIGPLISFLVRRTNHIFMYTFRWHTLVLLPKEVNLAVFTGQFLM